MMSKYKVLSKEKFNFNGDYQFVPIRFEDRYEIMNWRNEQIYHLRQHKKLTREDQDEYFVNVISSLFDKNEPEQILFSILKMNKCVGYCGLVHINWNDRNAELSLVMDTKLESNLFETLWLSFLNFIKIIAFKELNLVKIYTFAYDLRPKLYQVLKTARFTEEARLKNHVIIENRCCDVLIHSFFNPLNERKLRKVNSKDLDLLYRWANDPLVRSNSLNSDPITASQHKIWFDDKLNSDNTSIMIFENNECAFGQVRFDLINGYWLINYSVDKGYRGIGLGKVIMYDAICAHNKYPMKAVVKNSNYSSIKIFENLGFTKVNTTSELNCIEFIKER